MALSTPGAVTGGRSLVAERCTVLPQDQVSGADPTAVALDRILDPTPDWFSTVDEGD